MPSALDLTLPCPAAPLSALMCSWSGRMMLDHLGHKDAADAIVKAIEVVLGEAKALTPDMGGKATTVELGKAIAEAI